ncbi:hypothetical protein AVEN_94720-1 [Araneus ventricosus]|uniref:Jerky-like n=1 Tax=Araneus ventricosus TaxID=182803 RepID=A0A4Y2CNC2_ARAVE|nr:hypothetical protein AVEN_94720-1 [Araneus ventricosus]
MTTKDPKDNNKKKKKENQGHFEIKNTVLKLPGCTEVTDNCVEEWLYGDEEEEITDNAIIRIFTEEEETDETENLNDETDNIISHAEGTAALDVALRYIEQQPDALLHNVLFLKSLRENVARRDFVLKNKQL